MSFSARKVKSLSLTIAELRCYWELSSPEFRLLPACSRSTWILTKQKLSLWSVRCLLPHLVRLLLSTSNTFISIELMHTLCYYLESYLPTVCGYCKMTSYACPGFCFHDLILDAHIEIVLKRSYLEPKNIICLIHKPDSNVLLGPNQTQVVWQSTSVITTGVLCVSHPLSRLLNTSLQQPGVGVKPLLLAGWAQVDQGNGSVAWQVPITGLVTISA